MIGKNKKFEIRVPGSTANLGHGFDSLGLALPFYLTIRVQTAEKNSITLTGKHLESVPTDENNLIYKSIKHLFDLENEEIPAISLEIESDIPLTRGLGSSAAAIIAGLLAANELLDKRKTMEEIFQISARMEEHADNVGASLFGGLVVSAYDGEKAHIQRLPFPDDLKIMLAIPEYTLYTSVARGQIPERIPLKDVSFNIGHTALLVTYLITGQLDKIPMVMKDRVHQPYRQNSVKGLEKILKQAQELGLYSAALSGAGPTIILFVQEKSIKEAEKMLRSVALEEAVDFTIKTVSYAKEGAKIYNSVPDTIVF